MEVRIKDFNCIKDIDIVFKEGLNIIQGPSNSGKSSIVKAIENCIFNQSGTVNVRQGCKNYSVGIKHKDHTVSLIKGKDTKYKVDDVIYEKIGVNQLAEVAEALNIRETILGGEKVRLNFSKQLAYPFLLDKTPGQLYRFIVDSSESESLSNVLKDINKDIKDIDKAIIQNEAQIDILTKQQIQLNNNLENADKILEVSNQIIELDTECNSINALLGYYNKYKQLSNDVNLLKQKYGKMNISIDTKAVDNLYEDLNITTQLVNKFNTLLNDKMSLVYKIQKLSININTKEVDELLNTCNKLIELQSKYNSITKSKITLNESMNTIKNNIKDSQEKLSSYKVCPLCGNDISNCKEGE